MTANSDNATTELLELAKASWNPALLVPTAPELFTTRPLMVLLQQGNQSLSAGIDDIRQTALEQLDHIASFSHFIEPHEGVSVIFLAEFGHDSTLVNAMLGEHGELHAATDLRKAIDLAPPPEPADPDDEGEPMRAQNLLAIIVLPESAVQHIDLESLEEALPDFTGRAYFYDPDDGCFKQQAWNDGELDTGYLWAIREDEGEEQYTEGDAPGRSLFAMLASPAGGP